MFYLMDERTNTFYDIDLLNGNLLTAAPEGSRGKGCEERDLLAWQLEQCAKAVATNRPGSYNPDFVADLIEHLIIVPEYSYRTNGSIIYPDCFNQ